MFKDFIGNAPNMQTFKQFLAERRSTPISLEKAISWMENNAMDYLNGGVFLYRGIRDEPVHGITFADTSEGKPRKSIGGMANFYTLWMSYDPDWAGKPRRERSFIVSSSIGDASSWGKLHIVVPSNNSKIGAVDADDIWNKRNKIVNDEGLRLARFTTMTRKILSAIGDVSGEDIHTYSELAKSLKAITLEMLLDTSKVQEWHIDKSIPDLMKKHGAENLFDLWKIVLSPSNFQFMTPKNITGHGEFWIDGQALYIPIEKRMSDADIASMIDWSKEHAPRLANELTKRWLN